MRFDEKKTWVLKWQSINFKSREDGLSAKSKIMPVPFTRGKFHNLSYKLSFLANWSGIDRQFIHFWLVKNMSEHSSCTKLATKLLVIGLKLIQDFENVNILMKPFMSDLLIKSLCSDDVGFIEDLDNFYFEVFIVLKKTRYVFRWFWKSLKSSKKSETNFSFNYRCA